MTQNHGSTAPEAPAHEAPMTHEPPHKGPKKTLAAWKSGSVVLVIIGGIVTVVPFVVTAAKWLVAKVYEAVAHATGKEPPAPAPVANKTDLSTVMTGATIGLASATVAAGTCLVESLQKKKNQQPPC